YHEAFHAFTQTFMTSKQRVELYNETRNKSGSFTDHKGSRVSFKKATDLQLEEYLAEDFRKYMLNGNKAKANSPKRNSFFTKVLNILKALFSKSSVNEITLNERADTTINNLYENLRV